MRFDIRGGPAYAVAYCQLEVGEMLRGEAGSMIAMSGGMNVSSDVGPGGVAKGVLRKILVSEGLFMTRFTATAHGAWVALAPPFPGDITAITLRPGERIVAESGAVLALEQGVEADPKFAGLAMTAMREGATRIALHGAGTALLAAYGGVERFDLVAGQVLVFDSGHVVAHTADMKVRVGLLSGLVTSALSREGLVAELTGPGQVWVQTRTIIDKGAWLAPRKTPRT